MILDGEIEASDYLFDDFHQVRYETEKFIWKYNNIPHDRLDNITPRFLLKYGKLPAAQADKEYPTVQQRVYDNYYDIRV